MKRKEYHRLFHNNFSWLTAATANTVKTEKLKRLSRIQGHSSVSHNHSSHLPTRVVRHWHRLLREVVDSQPLMCSRPDWMAL